MGRIISVSQDGKQVKSYKYDAIGRLLKEKDLVKATETEFRCDESGNISSISTDHVDLDYNFSDNASITKIGTILSWFLGI